MITLPITEQTKQPEWNTVLNAAKSNGFPLQIICKPKKKIILKTQKNKSHTHTNTTKKWDIFTYHIPLIHKLTSLLKNTNLNIAFRTINMIYNKLRDRIPLNKINSSGICVLKCKTCSDSYFGQTGRWIGIRHREHTRYMKTNNPLSAYALHILNNKHEYGNADQTVELLKPCNRRNKVNCWESFCVQIFQHQNKLIDEQKANDLNPPYTSTNVTRRHVM